MAAWVAGAGLAMQGYGNYLSGQSQADALQYQSQAATINANEARQQGAFEASRSMVFANQKIGAQVAGYAAAGVDTTSGSALAVIQSSHANAELDRLNILHGADIKAINFENQSSIDKIAAGNTRQAGNLGLATGGIGAGANAYAQTRQSGGYSAQQQTADENEFASVGGNY